MHFPPLCKYTWICLVIVGYIVAQVHTVVAFVATNVYGFFQGLSVIDDLVYTACVGQAADILYEKYQWYELRVIEAVAAACVGFVLVSAAKRCAAVIDAW